MQIKLLLQEKGAVVTNSKELDQNVDTIKIYVLKLMDRAIFNMQILDTITDYQTYMQPYYVPS